MESPVEDTKAWAPVSLEKSHLLRPTEPDGILLPRPVLTLRTKDDGTQEVKCRCTLQGFNDPDVQDGELHVVHERSGDDFAVDCLVLTVGDVKVAFLPLKRMAKKGPLYMTMPKPYVTRGIRLDQLFEVRGGYNLGDQPQQWWRTF